jgi:predicted nucleic acid-binding protein
VILVDSSVWIDLLNNVVTEPVKRLRELIPTTPLLIGDLILCEVLQGFRTEAQARLVERSLRRFEEVSLLDPELAVKVAANYRFLRRGGSQCAKRSM